jgi:rubrerythrin
MKKKETMPKALRAALKLEHKGSAFYLRMSRKTENVLAKRLFDHLAMQEMEHIGRINEIHAAVSRGQPWPVPERKRIGYLEAEVRKLFAKLVREGGRPRLDNAAGMKIAMDMEWYSYRMYDKLAREAEAGPEKEFFTQISREEAKHHEALSNVYAYLTDNGDWLERSESQTWNWMNS